MARLEARHFYSALRSCVIVLARQTYGPVLRHLKGEAETRQILARMVVRIGQLRQPVIIGARLATLVDRRPEIDVVPARFACRLHEGFDVALAVETTRIAGGRVVVGERVDVGGLAPAGPLEVDLERGAGRTTRYIERQRRRHDPECAFLARTAGCFGPKGVRTTKIVGR